MIKYKHYSLEKVFTEGGAVGSFTLPDDCTKIVGIHVIPQLPSGMPIPNNKAFLIGNLSVLVNNKTDNAVHDYPLMCYPDSANNMSLGDGFVFENKHIGINTKTVKGNVISFIYKDSGYMESFVEDTPATYSDYNINLDIYIAYEDKRGDWANGRFGEDIKLLIQK